MGGDGDIGCLHHGVQVGNALAGLSLALLPVRRARLGLPRLGSGLVASIERYTYLLVCLPVGERFHIGAVVIELVSRRLLPRFLRRGRCGLGASAPEGGFAFVLSDFARQLIDARLDGIAEAPFVIAIGGCGFGRRLGLRGRNGCGRLCNWNSRLCCGNGSIICAHGAISSPVVEPIGSCPLAPESAPGPGAGRVEPLARSSPTSAASAGGGGIRAMS